MVAKPSLLRYPQEAMTAERPPEIHLLGQRIPLKALETDSESARAVLELVSKRLESAERRLGKRNVAPHQVALLALLDLAEDYIKSKQNVLEYQKRIQEKSAEILKQLEAGSP